MKRESLRKTILVLILVTHQLHSFPVVGSDDAREWIFEQPVLCLTATPDIIRIIRGVRSTLECAAACGAYIGNQTCRLFQFYTPTGECQLLASDQASNVTKVAGWSAHKVQDQTEITNEMVTRPACASTSDIELGDGDEDDILNNPAVPLTECLPRWTQPGRTITVSGRPVIDAERFNFMLKWGSSEQDNSAFILEARFNFSGDHNVLLLNSKMNGQFCIERRIEADFPFQINVTFEMKIEVEATNMNIILDSKLLAKFTHRVLPLKKITHLMIHHNVEIDQIRFQ